MRIVQDLSVVATWPVGGPTDQGPLPGRRARVDLLRATLEGRRRIGGGTHGFYRYPARFPPEFARAAISEFSRQGDVVLDPFMGGGTSAVESLALGRRYIGVDVNPVSVFVARAKTTRLTGKDASVLLGWAESLRDSEVLESAVSVPSWSSLLGGKVPWWLSREIWTMVQSADELPEARQARFGRCTILRTAQWALDNRRLLVTTEEFRAAHRRFVSTMLGAAVRERVVEGRPENTPGGAGRRFLCRSASGLDKDRRVPAAWKPVKLVLTSPPYPGVHVLYHRWQVQGRRETAAPFWIVGEEDGHPASYYTMGPRDASDLSAYLVDYESSLRSIAAMMDRHSTLVQLMGFSNRETQLGPVLDALDSLGFVHADLAPKITGEQTWRSVPNRRWYAAVGAGRPIAREVLLVHTLPKGGG
jgi:hypothetical protein